MADRCIPTKCLGSSIINEKKKLIINVNQSTTFVFPNQHYQYELYVKNVSSSLMTNVRVWILNQEPVVFTNAKTRGETLTNTYYEIGDLRAGESILLTFDVFCSESGAYNVNFLTYGDSTSVEFANTVITCGYTKYVPETYHRIDVLNFDPYEKGYYLKSSDYNDNVTQLTKEIHKAWKKKEFYYSLSKVELDLYDQDIELKNKDYFPLTYLGREENTSNVIETFEGSSLRDLIRHINENSNVINISYLRSGNNEMELDLQPLHPEGFINRFGLLRSEIYQKIGVIPTFSYMVDRLFRWAREDDEIANLIYPPLRDYNWDENKWVGHGWYVYTYYDDYENDEHWSEETMFCETEEEALTYIAALKSWDEYSGMNKYDEDGTLIRGYRYYTKESLYSEGVFFINIPVNQIPKNFYPIVNSELTPIIEKTKPYGLKPIVRFIINGSFDLDMDFDFYVNRSFTYNLDIGDFDNIKYNISKTKYDDINKKWVSLQHNSNYYYPALEPGVQLSQMRASIDTTDDIFEDNELLWNDSQTIETKPLLKMYEPDNAFPMIINSNSERLSFYKKTNTLQPFDKQNNDVHVFSNANILSYSQVFKQDKFINIKDINEDIPIENRKIILLNVTQFEEFVERAIVFNKKHIFSYEYVKNYNSYLLSYKIFENDKVTTVKSFLDNEINKIACEIYQDTATKRNIVFFYSFKKGQLHYLTHVDVKDFDTIDATIRNTNRIKNTSTLRCDDIEYADKFDLEDNIIDEITYNTPQFYDIVHTDSYEILDLENSKWNKLYRINDDENSYASLKAVEDSSDTNISLFIPNPNLPENAIVRGIGINTIINNNASNYMKVDYKNNINYTQDTTTKDIILDYSKISFARTQQDNQEYLRFQKQIYENNPDKTQEYNNALKESITFDKNHQKNVGDDFVLIDGNYWTEFDFKNDFNISLRDVSKIELICDGYNNSFDTIGSVELFAATQGFGSKDINIQKGYFEIHMPLNIQTSNLLSNISCRIKIDTKDSNVKISNLKLKVTFNNKQELRSKLSYSKEKQFVTINNINQYFLLDNVEMDAQYCNTGILLNFDFGSIKKGQIINIYKIDIDIIYQRQHSELLIDKIDKTNLVINGKPTSSTVYNTLVYNEATNVEQPKYTDIVNNKPYDGIKLTNTIYQSFEANDPDITSLTLYPNGFFGNPDNTLKISLMDDYGGSPNKELKTIYVNAWKSGMKTMNYSFNYDKLEQDKTYWIKIKSLTQDKNNYYKLKGTPTNNGNFKMCVEDGEDLTHITSNLRFSLQKDNNYINYTHFPIAHLGGELDIENPYILLKINNEIGEISKLNIYTEE